MNSPETKKQIILIPGLGDHVFWLNLITKGWKYYGVETHIPKVGWYDNENFETKFERMSRFLNNVHKQGKVSVIGTSAGGSFAFNLFQRFPDKIEKAVNVCGRLRTGEKHRTFRSLDTVSHLSPSFKESVLLFETNEQLLSSAERKRMMTIKPVFGDEAVPPETVGLKGAHNIEIYTAEHIISIGFSLLFPAAIFDFLSA
jgi:pimeloyl-ACP methyl ester carboxylesterase